MSYPWKLVHEIIFSSFLPHVSSITNWKAVNGTFTTKVTAYLFVFLERKWTLNTNTESNTSLDIFYYA